MPFGRDRYLRRPMSTRRTVRPRPDPSCTLTARAHWFTPDETGGSTENERGVVPLKFIDLFAVSSRPFRTMTSCWNPLPLNRWWPLALTSIRYACPGTRDFARKMLPRGLLFDCWAMIRVRASTGEVTVVVTMTSTIIVRIRLDTKTSRKRGHVQTARAAYCIAPATGGITR
jgi:hypothetical protein